MDPIRTIFAAAVVLGILVLLSPGQDGMTYLTHGTSPDVYDPQTATAVLAAGKPPEVSIKDLDSDAQHSYRLYFQAPGKSGFEPNRKQGYVYADTEFFQQLPEVLFAPF